MIPRVTRGTAHSLLLLFSTACGDDSQATADASAAADASVELASGEAGAEPSLSAGSDANLFLYSEPNFAGARTMLIVDGCVEGDLTLTQSLRAAPGWVCFAHTGVECTGRCGVCIDDEGWPSTEAFRGRFHLSGRCVRADASKCANAACDLK